MAFIHWLPKKLRLLSDSKIRNTNKPINLLVRNYTGYVYSLDIIMQLQLLLTTANVRLSKCTIWVCKVKTARGKRPIFRKIPASFT